MTLHRISPEGIEKRDGHEPEDRSGVEPGDHLSSDPDGPARGEESAATEGATCDESIVVLSDPIAADLIDPKTPYVLKDSYGRVLSVDNSGSGSWQWAYVGPYDSYPQNVFPLYWSKDPTKTANLSARGAQLNWPLHSNGKATSWEWTFWAKSDYGASYPTMDLTATVASSAPNQPDRYSIWWTNGSTKMYLAADSGTWNWLYASSQTTSTEWTMHKFYLKKSKMTGLFQNTWPSASFDYMAFNTGDEFYEAIDDPRATSIYHNSGLPNYSYKPEIFDCDDYSYVYKAQASKDAYANAAAEYGYAVGVIFARAPSGAHATNVFVDTKGTVRILEPQGGKIVAGKDWKDDKGAAYTPYFVLM